ncbi:putative FBD-associated F-box protein At5g56560 [Raphanus sativus]|uniref:FBD-associated F-box protein At5g56560 n=1 Tax=Raphanus sativus TaxID=3726 RepID=A0A9W3D8Y3_RAPSA|nr:putative FBD-associated F-box protein At5g56560 [Raphanus sativus]
MVFLVISHETIASLLQVCPVLEYLVVSQTKDDNVMFKVVPPWFCLPSLKSLHLLSVKFSGDKSLAKLLESCEVLDNLVVKRTQDDNVMIFNINVPSLRSLSVENFKGKRAYVAENHGFVINAPFLEKLYFKDAFSNFLKFEHMPKVIKANIQVICGQSEKFIRSIASIQHLSLCSLTSETPYPCGTVFHSLEHLELCTCSAGWANLLASRLSDAPRLRSLKLKSHHSARYNDPMNPWNEPTVSPECLSTHLENLEWRQYEGTEQERNVAAYILANATCLKIATFSTRCRNKYHRMLKKLKKLNKVSEICQLVFE